MTTIVCTSDTHFPFSVDMIPDGDVFIHAGDLMYSGEVSEWRQRVESLKQLPHKTKLLIPGNHDFFIESYHSLAAEELLDAGVELLGPYNCHYNLNGLSIIGLPWVTNLRHWAYNVDEKFIEELLIHIPVDPDIVVSHAPMRDVLDAVEPGQKRVRDQKHVGCLAYRKWFQQMEVKPKYWISGHIHESYGQKKVDGCTFLNASMCDRDYKQVNPPLIIKVATP